MRITIGEVLNAVLPYATTTESYFHGDFPYLYAGIGNSKYMTRLHLSILQVEEHMYAVAESEVIVNGEKYLPTEDPNNPFIKESDYLTLQNPPKVDPNITLRVSGKDFPMWLNNKLWEYGLIKFDPENMKQKVVELGFNSRKIKGVIRSWFDKTQYEGTIDDMNKLVMQDGKKLSLAGLQQKEIKCIYAKLRSLGVIIGISNDKIIKISFERGKAI